MGHASTSQYRTLCGAVCGRVSGAWVCDAPPVFWGTPSRARFIGVPHRHTCTATRNTSSVCARCAFWGANADVCNGVRSTDVQDALIGCVKKACASTGREDTIWLVEIRAETGAIVGNTEAAHHRTFSRTGGCCERGAVVCHTPVVPITNTTSRAWLVCVREVVASASGGQTVSACIIALGWAAALERHVLAAPIG